MKSEKNSSNYGRGKVINGKTILLGFIDNYSSCLIYNIGYLLNGLGGIAS